MALSNGAKANYVSGNGTDTLSFEYIIQSGDTNVNDLNLASSNPIEFATGETIKDGANNGLDQSTLPTGGNSLAGAKNIEIDTVVPPMSASNIDMNLLNRNNSAIGGSALRLVSTELGTLLSNASLSGNVVTQPTIQVYLHPVGKRSKSI